MNEPLAPPGLIDAAALKHRLADSRQRVAAAQLRAQQAKASLEGQTTTAASPDRAVTVTVSAAGTLVDLSFAQSASKLPLSALARSVLATYRQATAEAVAMTEALMRSVVGDDATVLDLVRASAPGLEETDQP